MHTSRISPPQPLLHPSNILRVHITTSHNTYTMIFFYHYQNAFNSPSKTPNSTHNAAHNNLLFYHLSKRCIWLLGLSSSPDLQTLNGLVHTGPTQPSTSDAFPILELREFGFCEVVLNGTSCAFHDRCPLPSLPLFSTPFISRRPGMINVVLVVFDI